MLHWVKVYLIFKWECEKINLILNENFDYFHSVIWNKEMAGFIFYRVAASAGMLERPELVRVGTHRHEHTHTHTHTHTQIYIYIYIYTDTNKVDSLSITITCQGNNYHKHWHCWFVYFF